MRTRIRRAGVRDGARVWELVRSSPGMDLNSAYCYVMLARYFPDTIFVAEAEEEIVGTVTAFRIPERPDTLFVWQIVVSDRCRGQGVGIRLLRELIDSQIDAARYVEATISPGNRASRALFARLARERDARLEEAEGFAPEHFPGASHEAEPVIRVGPLRKQA